MIPLELYAPRREDLWFRQALLADPATMSYNKGYELGFPEYHNDTGCIDFPEAVWDGWYARWVNREPERFYAYLRETESGSFLGEANLYQTAGPDVYEMGIVLHSAQRGKGYAKPGLALLLAQAFERMGAKEVTNRFERSRTAALRAHLEAGFRIVSEEEGLMLLSVSREDWKAGRAGRL